MTKNPRGNFFVWARNDTNDDDNNNADLLVQYKYCFPSVGTMKPVIDETKTYFFLGFLI